MGRWTVFFNRVAKAFSLELGLPPSWEIADQQQIAQLQDEAIETILRSDNIGNLLHLMEKGEAQRRIASLIRDTVKRIYSVFRETKREAWDQLRVTGARLPDSELLELQQTMTIIGEGITQKSFREMWHEKLVAAIETGQYFSIVDETAFQNFLIGKNKYGSMKFYPGMAEVFAKIEQHVTAIFTEQLSWQNQSTAELLELFSGNLEHRKDETGQLGFDDVTARLTQFMELWSTEKFAFRLDHQIQHLLLDEFQDTSLKQWEVIRPFALKSTQDDPTRSFFCVGDLKQAIYRWRGGVAEIFDLIEKELPNISDGESLTMSYRSSPTVIQLVNDIFENLDAYRADDDVVNRAVDDWSRWFETHSTTKSFPGYASIEVAKDCDERVKRRKDSGESTRKARNRNVKDAAFERIRKLHENLPPHHTIGVLFRTNAGVADMIFRLQRARIPASEEGGTSITDSAAVELVLSAMQMADHPNDDLARFHISHSPLAGMFELEPESEANQEQNRKAAESGAKRLRQDLVLDGYGPTIERMAKRLLPYCTRRETRRIRQLVRIGFATDREPGRWNLRPSLFVRYVREEVKVSDQSSARIRVMTIHQSKGLEFDAVVLPMEMSANDFAPFPPDVVVGRDSPTDEIHTVTRYVGAKRRQLLPDKFQAIFDEDRRATVRESMCLLYVALTRAVHAVHIIVSYGAKPSLKSAESVLLSTLVPRSKEKGYKRETGVIYEHPEGNELWYKSLGQPDKKTEPDHHYYLPAGIKLGIGNISTYPKSGRGRSVQDASHFGAPKTMKLGEIFDRRDNADSLSRGQVLHHCFELIRWLEFGRPEQQELVRHLESKAPWLNHPERVAQQFYKMLDHPSVQQLLTKQSYLQNFMPDFIAPAEVVLDAYRLEVQTERAFATSVDNALMHGRVDRLVFVYEAKQLMGVDIIDFKSDSVESQRDPVLRARYEHQIENYRRAVAEWTGLEVEQVCGRLVYVENGEVVNLSHGRQNHSVPAPKAGRKRRKKQPSKKPKGDDPDQLRFWE